MRFCICCVLFFICSYYFLIFSKFQGMFTKYLTFLKTKKWIAKDILLGITVNFLDYIAQHEMDIANASVGCCPSPKIELVNLLAKNSMVGVFGEASFADLYVFFFLSFFPFLYFNFYYF